jgi:pimeloyl-ACP methyl ester carboxylesterase
MTARERVVELPYLRVAALEWGAEGAPPVLALHGWLDNAASFRGLAQHLEGLHLVALDLPGHGRSERIPDGSSHHFVDWVPVVLQMADALGWNRLSLIGHSMGAGIASLIPAVAQDLVERIVLVEGLGPLSTSADQAPKQLAKALQSEHRLISRKPRIFEDLDAAVAARMNGTELDRESARILVERSSEAIPDGVRFTYDPRLKSGSRVRLTENQVIAFLRQIECPVLAIGASDGWNYPEGVIERRLTAISKVETAQVDGGHHVHLTHPQRVAPLIRNFFGV